MGQQINILVSKVLAVHLLDTVGQQTTVQTDETGLGQFAYQRGDVLVFNIGIGIILGTRSGVGCLAIVNQKVQLLHGLAVFGVTLAIQHKRLGHLVETFLHEGFLYLVLDVFHLDTFVDVEMGQYFAKYRQINGFLY